MPPINFGIQSYQHASLPLSAQRCVNAYLEPAPQGAKTPAAVLGCFGIRSFVTIGKGPLRGGILVNRLAYIVSGQELYSFNGAEITVLGAIPNSDRVLMASDGSHLVVVTQRVGYVWNGATLTQITDTDFPGYQWMTYLDGYFIGGPGDRTFFINHTAFDPTSFDGLDFASAESSPGNIVAGIVDHREVFLLKTDAVEVWYNSGDPDFPLTRTASGYMEVGCTSRFGPQKIDNSIFFPATDGTVRRVNGYTPVRISQTAMEQAIAKYVPQEVIGHSWIENGHSMYGLTYHEATWVYDISTQLWHERQSYGLKNWRAAFLLRAENHTLVGDSLTNRVGILDQDRFSEWDQALVASVTSPTTPQVEHARLELEFESGVGSLSGQGIDPQCMLQYSEDGGRTWSNEIWRSLGQRGDFKRKVQFNRLGTPRLGNRVYRYSISDPTRRNLIQATLNDAA